MITIRIEDHYYAENYSNLTGVDLGVVYFMLYVVVIQQLNNEGN